MSNRTLMRGLLIVGLIGVLCAWGLAAERSTQRSQDKSGQQGQEATQERSDQQRQATTQERSASQRQTMPSQGPEMGQAMMLHRTSVLIGKQVKNTSGEDLGSVHDLVLAPDYQQVSYIALSQGGILGVGSKLFAIPWEAVRVGPKGEITMAVSKDQFSRASGFSNDRWPIRGDYRWLSAGMMGGSSPSQQQMSTTRQQDSSSQATDRATDSTRDPNRARSGSTARSMTQDPNRALSRERTRNLDICPTAPG